uniref:Cytochrome P450 n=1 Tax=Chenopodium quinoa TaxID=63459 RepID=A0A803KY35_CHEQI
MLLFASSIDVVVAYKETGNRSNNVVEISKPMVKVVVVNPSTSAQRKARSWSTSRGRMFTFSSGPSREGKYLAYNGNTLVTAPYGDHWRNLRKICLLGVLSTNCLRESVGIRSDEVKQMLSKIYKCSSVGYGKVEMKSIFRDLVFNVLLRMLAGKRYFGEGVKNIEEAKRFTDIIRDVLEVATASNPADFLPVMRWIDYGGYIKRIKGLAKKSDDFLQGLIDEQRKGLSNTEDEETMISRLLSLQKSDPEYYTDETIKGLILVLLVAGTDTTSATMEWTMSLLLNNPNVMDKVQSEIDSQVGQDNLINELDIPRLPYLQNVILETLRMFPAVPLLLPHMSSRECQIGGFDVPRGTMLLVNAWAIHRDPNVWDEPTEFKPERFQNMDFDQYTLLPFGTGRRGCPGATLGNRIISLALGSLIQCYYWKRISDEEVDMTEGTGLNMPKAQPLEAVCKARTILSKIL